MSNLTNIEQMQTEISASAFDVFAHDDFSLLQPYVDAVREYALTIDRSIDTPAQRKELASKAHSFAKQKVALLKIGADESKRVKEIPKAIDANRKQLQEVLEQVQAWIREPLTLYEQAEKERISTIQANIDAFKDWENSRFNRSIDDLENRIKYINELVLDVELLELEQAYLDAKTSALTALNQEIDNKRRQLAERAELDRLREESERLKREAELEKVKAEAAEQARLQAQREKEAELELERLRIKQIEIDAENAKQAAIDAEQARIKAEQQALADAEAAKKKAEAEKQAAIEQERQRAIDAENARIEQEKARAADVAHRSTINRQALIDLIKHAEVDEEQAKRVITAVARGLVSSVTIKY